jgi:hypothetical protein
MEGFSKYIKSNQSWWPYACNPSTWKAEAGRFGVQDHPGLHSKTLFLKKKN